MASNPPSAVKLPDKRKLELGARYVHQLRFHVQRLFNELLLAPSASSDNAEDRLQVAHRNVLAIQKTMNDIELLVNLLGAEKDKPVDVSLGSAGLVSLDSSQDSSSLHVRAAKVFSEMRRTQEITKVTHFALARGDFRSVPSLELTSTEPRSMVTRATMTPETLDGEVNTWNSLHPKAQTRMHTIQSGVVVLQVDVHSVLTAYIQLDDGLLTGNVVVHGWREFVGSALPLCELISSESQHRVFQEVTKCCLLTMLSALSSHPADGKATLTTMLECIQSYHSLFSDVCSVCKRQLSMGGCEEGPLPPCWRDLKGNQWTTCHRSCRSP